MIAVDTNVLIYFYDERDPMRRAAATEVITSSRDGVLLWQVACEFIAASRKLQSWGFTPEIAWKRLGELRGLFPMVMPTPEVLDRAGTLISNHQIQFWDAMIYAASLEAGVQRLYSEDLPGAKIDDLEVVSPFK